MNGLIRVYTFPKGTNQGETYDLGRYRLEKLNTILPRTDGCCGPFYDLEGNLAPYAKVVGKLVEVTAAAWEWLWDCQEGYQGRCTIVWGCLTFTLITTFMIHAGWVSR